MKSDQSGLTTVLIDALIIMNKLSEKERRELLWTVCMFFDLELYPEDIPE